MQRPTSFVVRAPLTAGVRPGRHALLNTSAAAGEVPHTHTRARSVAHIIAATLFSLTALACGDERPPWTGFPLLPPDASTFGLTPELERSLAAAEIAFATQLASEQAGAADAADSSPNIADAGAQRPPRMAAETDGPPQNSPKADAPRKRSSTDAGAQMTAAAGNRSEPPLQPVASNVDAAMSAGAGGHAGAGGQPQPSGLDASAAMNAGAGGHASVNDQPRQPPELDAGPAMAAGAGGHAGSIDQPPQPPVQLDAGLPEPDADGG